jgi:hypothetical protein
VDARAAAEYVNHFLYASHRGAYRTHDAVIVYGNDGYKQDARSQVEVEAVRKHLDQSSDLLTKGYPPEFATSEDGYSWVLMFRDYSQQWEERMVDELKELVWGAWDTACKARGSNPVEANS